MTALRVVPQRSDWDCGIACLATVVGASYEEVLGRFDVQRVRCEGVAGLTYYSILEALRSFGFLGDLILRHEQCRWQRREPWPPAPMPELAIVQVQVHQRSHYVVWHDGRVLCPAGIVRDLGDPQNVITVYRRPPRIP